MIQKHRKAFQLHGKKLRRARHLYVLFSAPYIKTTIDINYAAHRMQDEGLYAEATPLKEIRFAILRKMWRLDGGVYTPFPNPNDWFSWLSRTGWGVGYWQQTKKTA